MSRPEAQPKTCLPERHLSARPCGHGVRDSAPTSRHETKMPMSAAHHAGRFGSGLAFESLRLPASELHDPPTADYKLCLVLHGDARLSYQVDDRWHSQLLRPGMFAPITPPHVAATFHLSNEQRHLLISVSEQAFASVAADAGTPDAPLGALRERAFSDPFLGQLCRRAWAETRRGDPLGNAFASSTAAMLVCGLLRSAAGKRPSTEPASMGRLSPSLLVRIREHCLARLHERISVASLAALVGLGLHVFGRAFKASTQQSPQQYLIALRSHRARDLLIDTDMAVADVALACGFYDQSHLTSTFTRSFGTAPSAYRRLARR